MTAHYLTTSAHADLIKKGEWCLIHGTGGGTCQWAAQMAKLRGYRVIGTVSRGKEAVASSLGCDELIVLDEVPGTSYEDYASVDVAAKVRAPPPPPVARHKSHQSTSHQPVTSSCSQHQR